MSNAELPTVVEDHLRKLALAFQEQALSEADTLRDLDERLFGAAGYEAREASLSAMRILVHRLAGRGGTFGFPDISTAASELEQTIDVLLPQISTLAPESLASIHALLHSLCREIATLDS